jgi:hypothetical protein
MSRRLLRSRYGFVRTGIVHFSNERAIVVLLEGGAWARSIDRADLAALEAVVNRLARRWNPRSRRT